MKASLAQRLKGIETRLTKLELGRNQSSNTLAVISDLIRVADPDFPPGIGFAEAVHRIIQQRDAARAELVTLKNEMHERALFAARVKTELANTRKTLDTERGVTKSVHEVADGYPVKPPFRRYCSEECQLVYQVFSRIPKRGEQ
jgi:hypothetical protein